MGSAECQEEDKKTKEPNSLILETRTRRSLEIAKSITVRMELQLSEDYLTFEMKQNNKMSHQPQPRKS